tara:strand:+ start:1859 stop:3601 length:1743 start_codon:yes stop_codon:yes gene_type:complete
MKYILIPALILSSLSAQFAVSILDFKGEDVQDKLLRACYNQLEESLIESNRFTVIDKSQRDEILDEQKFQNSGMCDDACAVEIGQLVGAEYLMLGEIIGFGDLYQVNIKIINIEKGDVAEKVTSQIEGGMSDLLNGIEDASQEIVRRIASGSAPQPVMLQSGQIATSVKTYGNIDIISEPLGADVLIDLVEYGVTPKTIEKIETGPHNLILNFPGYERLQKRIMVLENQTVSVSEYLVPKTGSLFILTEPPGANVYLDNITKGQTPLDLINLPVKDYIIKVELDDYQKIERRISVQYGENTTQKYNLDPLPGKLSLFTTPPSANININGKNYKSGSNGIASIELPVGRYNLKITKKGYEPAKREVFIRPNDLGTLDINLKRLPAGVSSNPDMGFLTVNTSDGRIRLRIPGVKEEQRLPLKYFELKYGTYLLKAYGMGLETEKRKVEIDRQRTTTIDINLKNKQKLKAVRYSMMFPGAGQLYAGSKSRTRGLIYAATVLGTGALLSNGITNYFDEQKLLDQYQINYKNATSSEDIDASWELYEEQSVTLNDAQTNMMILGTTLASAWLTSIIDAYFFSGLK